MATIQVLGTGCSRCRHLVALTEMAVREAGRDDVVEKVTDIMQILEFKPMALPALAINGRVVTAGTLPTSERIRQFLHDSMESASEA